jgi:hypothetical protein
LKKQRKRETEREERRKEREGGREEGEREERERGREREKERRKERNKERIKKGKVVACARILKESHCQRLGHFFGYLRGQQFFKFPIYSGYQSFV